MTDPYKAKVIQNLKKVRGQLDLLIKMVEDDRYCVDIIQQSNAAIGILRQANNMMLESHLHTCGKKLNSSDQKEREDFIKEIIRVCNVSNRKG